MDDPEGPAGLIGRPARHLGRVLLERRGLDAFVARSKDRA